MLISTTNQFWLLGCIAVGALAAAFVATTENKAMRGLSAFVLVASMCMFVFKIALVITTNIIARQ